MTHFVWNPALNTGHAFIDSDHRQLVGMINALYNAIDSGKDQDVMAQVLSNLIAYTKVHFKREEAAMLRVGYQKFNEHKFEHDKFVLEVEQLKKTFDNGGTLNAIQIGQMLSNWLRNHIVKVDMQLAAVLGNTQ